MERFPSVVADVAKELITINGDTSVRDAAQVMLEHVIGSIIVTEDGRPVGIGTKSDLLSRVIVECRDPCDYDVRSVMSAPLISVDKDTPILDAMRIMKNKKIGRLPVSDGGGRVGIGAGTGRGRAG